MDLFLMSPPGRGFQLRGRANFRSEAAPDVDARAARREWLTLAETIESLGQRVAVLPPDEALTGLPFAAEAGAPLPEPGGRHFLLSRMKHPHRQGEGARWRPMLEALGFVVVGLDRGVWEGQGDVARFFGQEVLELRTFGVAFHGNMALLPLEHAGIVLAGGDVLDDDALALLEVAVGRDRMVFVSEDEVRHYATNGLPIGDTLIAPSVVPDRVVKLVEKAGMKVLRIPMPELCEKAGGASRCLVCRIPDAGDVKIPHAYTLDAAREVILAD